MFCPNPECIDFEESGEPGEYVESMSVCPKCGTALVAERPRLRRRTAWVESPADSAAAAHGSFSEEEEELPEQAPPPAGPLVALAAFDAAEETRPLIEALADHGITAYQFLDDGRDFKDQEGIAPCVRLLVPSSQAKLAASVLEDELSDA